MTSRPHVLNENALAADWSSAWGAEQPEAFDVILGNPPFIGGKYQSVAQKNDLAVVLHGIPGSGLLDFVTGWFVKAARYMSDHPATRTAFVSTNSISQGEQVGVLWNELFTRYGCRLHFAHRTFAWTNEASSKAVVHVVIEGFGPQDVSPKRLFDYDTPRGEPHERVVSNINPYLVEGPDVVALRRSQPICSIPAIRIGNKPIDGGHYLFLPEEMASFIDREPTARRRVLTRPSPARAPRSARFRAAPFGPLGGGTARRLAECGAPRSAPVAATPLRHAPTSGVADTQRTPAQSVPNKATLHVRDSL